MKLASLSALALLGLASTQAPAAFDPVSEFSTAGNPNGVWTYGHSTTPSDPLAFDAYDTANIGTGTWSKSGSATDIQGDGASFLLLQPDGSDAAVLRFTAPSAGIYDITAVFTLDGEDGDGATAHVFFGIVDLDGTTLSHPAPVSDSFHFGPLFLDANTIIDFAVDSGTEAVGFAGSIDFTAAPEPASFGVLSLGLVALARRRRA
jgi:hypothetical protein